MIVHCHDICMARIHTPVINVYQHIYNEGEWQLDRSMHCGQQIGVQLTFTGQSYHIGYFLDVKDPIIQHCLLSASSHDCFSQSVFSLSKGQACIGATPLKISSPLRPHRSIPGLENPYTFQTKQL